MNAFASLSAPAESGHPADRLAALRAGVTGRIVFTTSFGLEDQVLAHLIFAGRLDIEVATLDTGRLFPSTYRVWEETERRYGVRIRVFHPEPAALAAFVAEAGIDGFYQSKDARLGCCHVRKVEPLARALAGAAAWVTGLRADQSAGRGSVELADWDVERQLIKFSPLFDWPRARVADFCAAEGVPVNALHALGYPSIGCEPCTRAVAPGEPERAGRWWWENDEARECGLHLGPDGKMVRSKAA
jgi:phosphoadenosine phosphosulfate reductase